MSLHLSIEAIRNALALEQYLLLQISDDDYHRIAPDTFHSTLGKHIRHNIDHVSAFLSGFDTGHIDYENRQRSEQLEQNRTYALQIIGELDQRLKKLSSEPDKSILIRSEIENDTTDLQWLASSCSRELQFLLSHSIHHHAIIATLPVCALLDLPPEFGIAPSTQRYEKQSTSAPSCVL